MSRYDVEKLIERGVDSRVVRAGARWRETRPGIEQLLIVVGVLSLFVAVIGLTWAMIAKSLNPLLVFGTLGAVAAFWPLVKVPGRPRAVYFSTDGAMKTPHGIYYHSYLSAIGGHNDDLVSIEARPQQEQVNVQGTSWSRLFEVVMLSRDGTLIVLSKNLLEHVALRAAAQLTQGLIAIRKDRADEAPDDQEAWGQLH